LCPKRSRVRAALKYGAESVLGLLFPRRCFSCGDSLDGAAPLCANCEERLSKPQGPVCFACSHGGTLSAAIAPGGMCVDPAHESYHVSAGFLMRGAGADLIHSFKYEGVRSIAPFVAGRMVRAWPGEADCLTPVPLHKKRERERGYNQSLLLAEELTELTGVLTAPGLLARVSYTRPQVGLAGKSRWQNVEGAFAVPSPVAVKGKRVVIIDDVATSGSTLRACADVLLRCGARSVGALVGALS
jgi:ComF family protein